MIALKDMMDALKIDAESLSKSTGIEIKRANELYEGKDKPSKLELTAMLSVLKIDYGFYVGEKDQAGANANERRINEYVQRKARMKAEEEALRDIVEKLEAAGYHITAEQAAEIYSPEYKAFAWSVVERNDARLLMAIRKAFPNAMVTGRGFNSEWKGKEWEPHPLFDESFLKHIPYHCKDPEIVYMVGKSDYLLGRFMKGEFPWDDEKVLYLIKKGSFCYSFQSGFEVRYEFEYFRPEKDVGKTLLIKDYCERQIAKKKGK